MNDGIAIMQGVRADLDALSRFHYRPLRPATCVQTLTACDTRTGEVVGVLAVSMPTLNGPWRAVAWPGVFGARPPKSMARRINTDLRTISRVIVDPRYRALGVARRLVGAYLASPLTEYSEALASMGRWCPFFGRAGMRCITTMPSAADRRLSRVLREERVRPWELVEVGKAAAVCRASASVRRALKSWGAYSRSTRHCEDSPVLAAIAGARLTARPLVFVSP